jgi:hypothetical protein
VNLLTVLAPTSKPVDPFDIGTNLVEQVAIQAAVKTLQVQQAMGQQVVRLLNPSLGNRFDRSA